MCPFVFLLLILMINFNGIIPSAIAEKYYNYSSGKNMISKIDVVKIILVITMVMVVVTVTVVAPTVTQNAAFLPQ